MDSSKKIFTSILHHSVAIILFILIPLFSALYLCHYLINLEAKESLQDTASEIKDTLKDIAIETNVDYFLLKEAREAWVTYNQKREKIDDFWNYYNNLCDYLKTKPDLYLFDTNGNLVTPEKYILKSRPLASKIWSSIDNTYEENCDIAIKYKKEFKSFLGNEFKLGKFLDNRDLLIPIIINAKTSYIFWKNSPQNPKEGILIIFWDIPSFNFRFKEIVKRYSSKLNALFSINNMGFIENLLDNKNISEKKADYAYILNETNKLTHDKHFIDSNDLMWAHTKIANLVLFGAKKCDFNNYSNYKNILNIIICILSIMFFLIYIWAIRQQYYTFSIKIKLIALFLIAIFTPVLCFSFLSYQYVSDLEDNIHINVWKESRELLLNIDRELGGSDDLYLEEFREMATNYQHYDENTIIKKKFDSSLANYDLVQIDRRLASDASLISQLTNYVIYDKMNNVTEPLAKYCIDKTLNTNFMDSIDPVLAKAMQSPESTMSSFWETPDKIQNISFGTSNFYLYWNYFESSNYGKEFIFILRSMDKVLKSHLQKRLIECKTNPKERDYLIFACNHRNSRWFPNNSMAKALKDFSQRIQITGKPKETHITIDSKKYLLIGLRCHKLKGYSLYALFPHEKIDKELNTAILDIMVHIILFIATALAIGYLFSRNFINPIKHLEDGLNAIKARNPNYRIEYLENDEFGHLADNFNKMISDLKEMNLAKSIQESLLPASLPKLNGYEICCSNKMASAIGGDYYDTILLDNENLCVIIGDVSGHGVASALVMAIAKSVIYHSFKETKNLIEIFSDLNTIINSFFINNSVKKMITLFATIINLPSGEAMFIDCGHNYPYKVSKDGQITELKMIGLPIGVLKKLRKAKVDNYSIENGDTVVFYTDGIIEATGKTKEQYGYDRFKQSLSEMAKESSETILNRLFENYKKWEDGTEPDDDVTLVILKRVSS